MGKSSFLIDIFLPGMAVFIMGAVLGATIAVHTIRNQAINADAAEWRVDKYGNTIFMWKSHRVIQITDDIVSLEKHTTK